MKCKVIILLLLVYYCWTPFLFSQCVYDIKYVLNDGTHCTLAVDSGCISNVNFVKSNIRRYSSESRINVLLCEKAWRRKEDEEGLKIISEESTFERLRKNGLQKI